MAMSLAMLLAAGGAGGSRGRAADESAAVPVAQLRADRVLCAVQLYGWAKDESAFAWSVTDGDGLTGAEYFSVVDANGKVALRITRSFSDVLDVAEKERQRVFRERVQAALSSWKIARPAPGPAGVARIAPAPLLGTDPQGAASRAAKGWTGDVFVLHGAQKADAPGAQTLQLLLARPGAAPLQVGKLDLAGDDGVAFPVWSPSQKRIAWVAVRLAETAGGASFASAVVLTAAPKR